MPNDRRRLGLVTIGQSPRPDLTADVADLLAGVDWVEHGGLDGVEDVDALAPGPSEGTLITKVRSGATVHLATERTGPLVDAAVASCVADDCTEVLLLCTGHLSLSGSPVPITQAEGAAHTEMARCVAGGRLGVIHPLPAQGPEIEKRWQGRLGRPILTAAASPYDATPDRVVHAARALADAGAEALFLDCMGYTRAHARLASEAAGVWAEAARVLAFTVTVAGFSAGSLI